MFYSMKVFMCLVLLFTAFCTHAQDVNSKNKGWFVGGALGSASTDLSSDVASQNERSGSFVVYGGYNFTDWFGLEASFFGTGDAARDSSYTSAFGGLLLQPKLTFHLNPTIAFFAKAGPASIAYVEEHKSGNLFGSHAGSQSWNNIVPAYGLGAEFVVTNSVRIRATYDHFSGTLEDDEHNHYSEIDTNLNLTSLGVHYQF